MQAEDFELITYHGPITLRLEPLNTKPDMTQNTSSGLGRREFLILSVCVTRALMDQSVEICWCICLGQMVHVLCAIAIEHAVQVVV